MKKQKNTKKETAPQKVVGSKPLSLDWSAAKIRAFMKTAEIENVFEKRGRQGHSVHFISSIADDDIKPVDSFHLQMTVDGPGGLIRSALTVPTHVPVERRTEVAAYCCYASSMVRAMKLHVDPIDGEVQAEMAIPVSALLGESDKELHRIIGMPMMMLEEFLPGLYDVIGGKDPMKVFLDSQDGVIISSNVNSRTAVGAGEGSSTSGGDISDCQSETKQTLSKDYDISGLNLQSKVPLDKIVGAVKKFRGKACKLDPDSPRLNLLLSGPPGTGKTEFVKYLGVKVGAKVISVTASDLLSPLVGKTEQLIAAKFAEAKSKNAILFIDEVDSFLQSREGASHSWEITQVNELLQQMEKFGGVLVAATNFKERLDKAVLRRFVYKLKLDYLTDEGKEIFFKRYFKTSLSSEERRRLHAIRDLAPGDYRVVRQSLYYTDDHPTNAQRLEALEAESAAKFEGRPGRIGF